MIYSVVRFKNQAYSIRESEGNVLPVLVLSNALSMPITVEVFSANGSATGNQKQYHEYFTVTHIVQEEKTILLAHSLLNLVLKFFMFHSVFQ